MDYDISIKDLVQPNISNLLGFKIFEWGRCIIYKIIEIKLDIIIDLNSTLTIYMNTLNLYKDK